MTTNPNKIGTLSTTAVTEIEDGTDSIHTGLIKVLNQQAIGSFISKGFNVAQNNSDFEIEGSTNEWYDRGEFKTHSSFTAIDDTLASGDNDYYCFLVVVKDSTTLAIRIPDDAGIGKIRVANLTEGDIPICLIKVASGSGVNAGSRPIQYYGSKKLDSKFAAINNSAETMKITKEGTFVKASNTGTISLPSVGSTNSTLLSTNDKGISNGNILEANANVADNDFLRVDGTKIEGRTVAQMKTDLSIGLTDVSGNLDDIADGSNHKKIPTADATKISNLTVGGAIDLDAIKVKADRLTVSAATDLDSIKTKADRLTISANTDLDAIKTKADHLTITGAINLDTAVLTDTQLTDSQVNAAIDTNTIATKAYADSIKQGLDTKDSVRVATTANITLSGTQTIDGISITANQRVLVKDQSTASQNGIYLCNASTWTRATDADSNADVTGGLYVWVEEGTVNADTGWILSNTGTITVGTTALTFTQFSGAGQITAGSGLVKSGNTINLNVDDSSVEVSSDAIRIKATGVTNDMLAGSIANAKLVDIAKSKISSTGTFAEADIPTLAKSKISGTGTFATTDIPDLNASKITDGTLPVARGGTALTSLSTLLNSNVTKSSLGLNGLGDLDSAANTKLAGIAANATEGASASQVTAINANTAKVSFALPTTDIDTSQTTTIGSDFLIIYDDDVGALRKVKAKNLLHKITANELISGGSGTGGVFTTLPASGATVGGILGSGGNILLEDGSTKATDATILNSNTSKSDVGLGNVENITTAAMREGVTAANVGLGNVTNVSQSTIQSATLTAATKADVGLGNVDNTSDATKQTAILSAATKSDVGLSNVLNEVQTTVFKQDDAPSARVAGDLWVDTNDSNKLYRATGTGTGNWEEVTVAKAALGLAKADVGLGNVDNDSTADIRAGTTAANVGLGNVTNVSQATIQAATLTAADKTDVGLGNVDNNSTATIRAGTTKANVGLGSVDNKSASTLQSEILTAASASDVGLGNVDNTADTAKPVSTAQQTALDAKVPTTRTIAGKALSSNLTLGIDASGKLEINDGGTAIKIKNPSSADVIFDNTKTEYDEIQDANNTKPADNATVGARLGTNLKAADGSTTLGDDDVKNASITLTKSVSGNTKTLSLTNANAATTTLEFEDGATKTQTFRSDDPPTAVSIGDLWVDTNDGNKVYSASATGTGGWNLVTASYTATEKTKLSGIAANATASTGDVTLTGTETLTNKTLTSPIINVGSDASGDLYYRAANGTYARLAKGTDGQVLKLASGLPSWGSAASSADIDVNVANLTARLPQITSDVTIGDATDVTVTMAGDLTVTGDLIVSGTTSTINTATVEVEDNILQLNTTQGSPDTATAATSGISVYRGNGVTQASFIFDESDDTWDLTNNLTLGGVLTATSPVFTTPNLGTPSAINLTNATSPPTWNQSTSGNAATATKISSITNSDIVQLTDSQTLTNKTIDASNNTLSNIANGALTNSSITINGSAISLGGSVNTPNTVYTHPNHSGDVTSSSDGATTIGNNKVTLAKMATMATDSLLGRTTADTGNVEVLSKTDVLSILNVADGAQVNVSGDSGNSAIYDNSGTPTLKTGISQAEMQTAIGGVYTDTVYTHPTTAGNKHIPAGGASGQFLKYTSSGTAVWATPSYTTNTDTNTFRTIELDTDGNDSANNTLGATETLRLKKGSNITLTESGGVVTISSTDTNTDTNTQLDDAGVTSKVLTGLSVTGTTSDVSATDTILEAIGHMEKRIRLNDDKVTNTDTNTNQLTTFTLRGTSGTSHTSVGHGDTVTITAGTGITTTSTSDGVITIDNTVTNTDTNTQNEYATSFVDSSDDILLRLTESGAGSGTQDIKFVAGSNITLTHTDANNITIAATDTNTDTNTTTTTDVLNALNSDLGGAVTFGDANDTITIAGNLTVGGDTVTVNTATLSVEDPLIYMANGQSGTPAVDIGIIGERGSEQNVGFIWDESADTWAVVKTNDVGDTAGNVTIAGYGNLKATTITGALTGNADTSTKIASITNSDIVQLTEVQTLTNKTLTSPTLTTPALGTPSALVLTNATALPAAQVSQGTMASGMVLVAPVLGTPASGTLTNATGYTTSNLVGTITNAQLAGSISQDKLAGSIANDKLATGISATKLTTGTLPASRIGSGAITEARLGTGAVTNDKVGANAIDTAELADSAVTGDKVSAFTSDYGQLTATLASNLGDNGHVALTSGTSGNLPTRGLLLIENELIYYTGISAHTTTGTVRGYAGTTAAAHTTANVGANGVKTPVGVKTTLGGSKDIFIPRFEGAGASSEGKPGLVPISYAGKTATYLRGDGAWADAGTVGNGNTGLVDGDAVYDYIAAQNFGSGSGDITAVVAGTGLSGGATSGSATLNIDSTVATLTGTQTLTNKTLTSPSIGTGFTFDGITLTTAQTSAESFADNDTSLMTSAAINDRIESFSYTTNTGDVTVGTHAGNNNLAFFSSAGVISNSNNASFTSATGAVDFFGSVEAGNVKIGTNTNKNTVETSSAQDLILRTNGGTNSGTVTLTDGANGNITLTPNGTGDLVLDGLKWPQADGTANYVLKTDGSAQLSWTEMSSGGDTNAGGVNGSASAPTFSFASDTNTGMFRLTGDCLGFSVGGTAAMYMQSSKIEANKPFEILAGSASAPSLAMKDDSNTGIYKPGADQIGFSTGGTERMTISAAGVVNIAGSLTVAGSAVGGDSWGDEVDANIIPDTNNTYTLGSASKKFGTSYFAGTSFLTLLSSANGSASYPTYTFEVDENTGMYRGGADTLGFSTGGTARLTIGSSGEVTIPGQMTSRANVVAASSNTTLTLAQSGSYVYWTGGTLTLPASGTVGTQYTVINNKGSAASITLNGTNCSMISGFTNAAISDHELASFICVTANNWIMVG